MNETPNHRPAVYIVAMALAGIGCTFLGPLLPSLSSTWHLQDGQAGFLISCLFAGSFLGSMLLSSALERNLRFGSSLSAVGLLSFAIFSARGNGYAGGAVALVFFGVGLGQLMSSTNLLVGQAPAAVRTRYLANLGSAWCCGAIISPLFAVDFGGITRSLRLGMLASLYILPLLFQPATTAIAPQQKQAVSTFSLPFFKMFTFWVATFLIYWGIEVAIGGWVPTFASRYQAGSAQ